MASSSVSSITAPVRGFDKAQFDQEVRCVALKLPAKACNDFVKLTKNHNFLLDLPRIKRIISTGSDNEENLRLILLSPKTISSLEPSSWPNELQTAVAQVTFDQLSRDAVALPIAPQWHSLRLGYDNFSAEEVLRALLPTGVEIPSSFEQIGTIAHLNIRDELLNYRYIIGQVILEKNTANIRTVVNKVGMIESEFRTFPMEVIAGEENYDVTVKECGATYSFSFRDVYWNSRLGTEHSRLIDLIANEARGKDNVVADMMAGVGPFAIPLGMLHKLKVYANDLNPSSYDSLVRNAIRNKCELSEAFTSSLQAANAIKPGKLLQKRKAGTNDSLFVPSNLDGRDFIINLAERGIIPNEVIMNLPANATDFLDVFIGIHRRFAGHSEEGTLPDLPLPRIHVYGFSTAADAIRDLTERAATILQCSPHLLNISNELIASPEGLSIGGHIVRDVAPSKLMICLSFILPNEVATSAPTINFSQRYDGSTIARVGKRAGEDVAIDSSRDEDHRPKKSK